MRLASQIGTADFHDFPKCRSDHIPLRPLALMRSRERGPFWMPSPSEHLIFLRKIFPGRDHLKIPWHMEPADRFPLQRDNVVDVVFNACLHRYRLSYIIFFLNLCAMNRRQPLRHCLHLRGAPRILFCGQMGSIIESPATVIF